MISSPRCHLCRHTGNPEAHRILHAAFSRITHYSNILPSVCVVVAMIFWVSFSFSNGPFAQSFHNSPWRRQTQLADPIPKGPIFKWFPVLTGVGAPRCLGSCLSFSLKLDELIFLQQPLPSLPYTPLGCQPLPSSPPPLGELAQDRWGPPSFIDFTTVTKHLLGIDPSHTLQVQSLEEEDK